MLQEHLDHFQMSPFAAFHQRRCRINSGILSTIFHGRSVIQEKLDYLYMSHGTRIPQRRIDFGMIDQVRYRILIVGFLVVMSHELHRVQSIVATGIDKGAFGLFIVLKTIRPMIE